MKISAVAKILGVGAVVLSVSGCLWAPDLDRVRKDIEHQIPGAKFDREIALSLGPIALTLVRGVLAVVPESRDAAGYVRDVRSVSVAVYTTQNLPADFALRLPEAMDRLIRKEGWEIAVKTREDGEAVWVLCKMDGDSIAGLYVLALDGDELVLVQANGRLEEMFKKAIRENVRPGKLARSISMGPSDA
jgi:hypothetical protein